MVQPSWKESIDPVVSKFFRRSHVAMALTLLALFIACGAVSPTGRHGAHAIVNAVVHAAELPTGHTPSQSSDDGQPKGPTQTVELETGVAHIARSPVAGKAVTLRSRFSFTGEGTPGVWMAGFASDPAGKPTALAASWASVRTFFGDTWAIRIQSDAHLIPAELSPTAGSGAFQGYEIATLLTRQPTVGHTYGVTFSYNLETGDAALQVIDETTGDVIFLRSLALRPYDGPLYPGVGKFAQTSSDLDLVWIDPDLQAEGAFWPLGLSWAAYQWEARADMYRPAAVIDRRKASALRLDVPWSEVPGAVLFWLDDEGARTLLARVDGLTKGYHIVPIELDARRAGSFAVVAEYVEGGVAREIGRTQLNVGVAEITYSDVAVDTLDRWSIVIRAAASVKTDGYMDRFSARVMADHIAVHPETGALTTGAGVELASLTLTGAPEGVYHFPIEAYLSIDEDQPYQSWEAKLSIESDTPIVVYGGSETISLLDLPRQIHVTDLDDPATTKTVSWRTYLPADFAAVHILTGKSSVDVAKPFAVTFRENERSWIYTALIEGLEPQTTYTAVIQHDHYYSLPFTFETAPRDVPVTAQSRRPPDIFVPLGEAPQIPQFHIVRPAEVSYPFHQELGRSVQQVNIPQGAHYGTEMNYILSQQGTPSGVEAIHMSWMMYLPEHLTAGSTHIKIPGVAHRHAHGWGGRSADGTSGWSVRMALQNGPDGKVTPEFYVYHMDMGHWGSAYDWRINIERGVWTKIEMYVRVNTPGKRDGVIRGWVDGALAFEKSDLGFRAEGYDQYDIAEIMWHVYHGGDPPSSIDQHILFRDLEVWLGEL